MLFSMNEYKLPSGLKIKLSTREAMSVWKAARDNAYTNPSLDRLEEFRRILGSCYDWRHGIGRMRGFR